MSDNESYWVKRHQQYVGDVRSVGNMAKSIQDNLSGYEEKNKRLKRALLSIFPKIHGLNILEVGCGIGMMAGDLVSSGGLYTGLDISPDALSQAKERVPTGNFTLGNAYDYKLPIKFDVIFCTDVLVHLLSDENWLGAIRCMKEHLKSNGVVIIKEVIYEDRRTPSPHVVSRSMSEYLNACDLIGFYMQAIDGAPGFYLLREV